MPYRGGQTCGERNYTAPQVNFFVEFTTICGGLPPPRTELPPKNQTCEEINTSQIVVN
jgi:hypothetical protein